MIRALAACAVLACASAFADDEVYFVTAAKLSSAGVTLSVEDTSDPPVSKELTFPASDVAWNLQTAQKVTTAAIRAGDVLYLQRGGAERRLLFITAGKSVAASLEKQDPDTAAVLNQLSASMRAVQPASPPKPALPPEELRRQARAFVDAYAYAFEGWFSAAEVDALVAELEKSPPEDAASFATAMGKLPKLSKRDADSLREQLHATFAEWAEGSDALAREMKRLFGSHAERLALCELTAAKDCRLETGSWSAKAKAGLAAAPEVWMTVRVLRDFGDEADQKKAAAAVAGVKTADEAGAAAVGDAKRTLEAAYPFARHFH